MIDWDLINQQAKQALIDEFGFVQKGAYLQKGKCPECHKKELFASAEKTKFIRCGRLNKCGWDSTVRDLFPDLFADLSKKYPPTPENPNLTADAYLQLQRGFDTQAIKGWYQQASFYDPKKQAGSPTVRFYLDNGKTRYWERFVENAEAIGRKAHFGGQRKADGSFYKGDWWSPPKMEINLGDEIWLVEGIFDALALMYAGKKAVSLMTCMNYPENALKPYLHQGITWVVALDNNKAGKDATHKMVKRLRDEKEAVNAALVPKEGLDWNDAYQKGLMEGKWFFKDALYEGSLLIAPSARKKCNLIYKRTQQSFLITEFKNKLYRFKFDKEKYDKELGVEKDDKEGTREELEKDYGEMAMESAGEIKEIANCVPSFLYYQRNPHIDEGQYYFRIRFGSGSHDCNVALSGKALSSAGEFKGKVMSTAPGALFTGKSSDLDYMVKDWYRNKTKVVNMIDFLGYDKESGIYVYDNKAIKDGIVYNLNKDDFFDVGENSIKSNLGSVHLQLEDKLKSTAWIDDIIAAYGQKGIVSLTYWFSSLFAEQLRKSQKSFPFLEIVGDAGSGKTTLIEFLWKLFGREDYEGFDPGKTTGPGRARNMAQVSNMPIVLIEGDRDESGPHTKKFDWEELKPAYNGRATRSKGVKDNTNATIEPPFKGALVIAQNRTVEASEAILTRICHLHFSREGHNEQSKQAADRLAIWPVDELSGFLVEVVKKEKQILKQFAEIFPKIEKILIDDPAIKTFRIAKCHAQLIAMLKAMQPIFNLSDTLIDETSLLIADMARERQQATNDDHPVVAAFWETYDYIEGFRDPNMPTLTAPKPRLNHSKDPDYIAINLNHFRQVCDELRLEIEPNKVLRQYLAGSKTRRFDQFCAVRSNVFDRTLKCWRFKVR